MLIYVLENEWVCVEGERAGEGGSVKLEDPPTNLLGAGGGVGLWGTMQNPQCCSPPPSLPSLYLSLLLSLPPSVSRGVDGGASHTHTHTHTDTNTQFILKAVSYKPYTVRRHTMCSRMRL